MRASDKYYLYLYNDNINSFEKVVGVLTDVLDWTIYQAEQCALIAHENERVCLRSGTFAELSQQSYTLKKAGITAVMLPTKDI